MHLKWVIEGDINSPRRPKRRHWLKAAQTHTVGSSGAPPRHLVVALLLTHIFRRLHRWSPHYVVGSSGAKGFHAKTFLLENTTVG
jgi:hypothetical protein